MSFAESYVLASKVRSKLTKEAANPKTSLRSLVLQANMLDNLMDHIAEQTEKKKASSAKVSFALPQKSTPQPISVSRGRGPSVTEYEVESDSDSDYDSDSDFEYDSDDMENFQLGTVSDSEDDYYYSSEEEEDAEVVQSSVALASVKSYKQLPVIDLSNGHDLLVILEEDHEEELPELSRSPSSSESEDDEVDVPNYKLTNEVNAYKITSEQLFKSHGPREVGDAHRHHRHNAIYLMEHVF